MDPDELDWMMGIKSYSQFIYSRIQRQQPPNYSKEAEKKLDYLIKKSHLINPKEDY